MTIDTQPLTDAIQTLLNSIFTYVPLALLIFGPIAAIGIGFKWGRQLLGMIGSFLGGGSK